jgi:hypothetical protein
VHGREQRRGESEDLGVGLKANLYPEAVETGADKADKPRITMDSVSRMLSEPLRKESGGELIHITL